ncbi:hypothetical protein ACN6MY_12410 [Peribacillus sp. B-H-3]|uniref:hypothetical protein n=1 Tax=Peribacillus sp. B-H-3 TaxID=3400420 RepID=UPI003B022F19
MIDEIMYPTLLSDSSIKLYMGLLMIELIKHSDKLKKTEHHSPRHYLMVQTMKYIDEHYREASLYKMSKSWNKLIIP